MGQPEEAAHASQPHEDDPPPPYSDEGAAPPLPPRDTKNNPFTTDSPRSPAGPSTSASKPKLPTPIAPTAKFPNTLGMYYQKAVRIPTFNLGETEDQPALAVTFHSSITLSGNPYLILHSTADPESPPLAIAEKAGRLGHRAEITLPALSGHDSDEATAEEMSAHVSITSVAYAFSVETRPGYREKFEWRSSKGSEVRALSTDKHAVGRKLVRLDTEADGVGGTRAVRDQGATSDGREVVAVWADNPKWSGNRAGTFQFLGSGTAGQLGERFSVMAVATSVRIWEMMNEASMHSAATSSLGAGNSS
ncbi:hypothetical protein SUNI508_03540 [Seiridium unicorne]|uniref:Uncharacterized protein n=1 Tax=Seiridium unicorne TaxID=138068 RepID=A0ABR2VDT9_9PEZI